MPGTSVTSLSWSWIGLMATVPPLVAGFVAYPIWQTKQFILGNLVGAVVMFVAAIGLILRESAELQEITQRCLDAGFTCWPDPAAFTRYAIYAGLALIEVFALFTVSLKVETRIRRRNYAPEWR